MSLLRLPVSLLRALRSIESKEAEAEAEEEDGQARQVARRARMLGWQEMQCDATAKQV
jgi:hypothetical protein